MTLMPLKEMLSIIQCMSGTVHVSATITEFARHITNNPTGQFPLRMVHGCLLALLASACTQIFRIWLAPEFTGGNCC